MNPGLPLPGAESDGTAGQVTPFLPDGVVPGAMNTPDAGRTAIASGNDGSGELRGQALLEQIERLAALLEPEAFGDVPALEEWRESAKARARFHASRAIFSGYRRVVEDDDTIERLAEVLAKTDGWFPWAQPADVNQEVALADDVKDDFRSMARAVVRALREET